MSIKSNIKTVQQRINAAAKEAGRNPEEIKLIAVSKTKPVSDVLEAFDAGMCDFGENRPQELAEKYSVLPQARWHLIGQLQRNKVKYIIDKAFLIHSVDSIRLAEEIEKRAGAVDKIQNILIQVNISGEESKSGIKPAETEELCRQISLMKHIHICGLMTISVNGIGYDGNLKIFSELKRLSQNIDKLKIPGVSMKELSMGMTHDYEAAVAAGATMVRVGSGIFGARNYNV